MDVVEKTVLIVDDEKSIVDILSFNLKKEGYKTLSAYDGPEGLEKALSQSPDLILLDVMLPGMDGFEVCRRIREKSDQVPIIMLTAREEESDKVLGLELGADDYITKPFSVRELLARVKANIRRTAAAPSAAPTEEKNLLVRGDILIDLNRYEAFKNGKLLELSQREFDLLLALSTSPGRVFTREELMTQVWNYEYFGDLRVVDVAVRRLREKLEDKPAEPAHIITRRGVGYYFED